jgi:hypothetical protein
VNVGHLYVIRTALFRPPMELLVICVCRTERLFFLINTLPRPHGVGQFPLTRSDHVALTRECHLDCSRVMTFSSPELANSQHRGPISPELAAHLLEYLTTNPPMTLTPKQLKVATENLSGLCH